MKTLLKTLLIMAIFISCSNDDDSNAQQDNYLNFDGQDDYVQINDSPPSFDFSGDFTIEARFKKSSLNTRVNILQNSKLSNGPVQNGFAFYVGDDNKVYIFMREVAPNDINIGSITVIDTANWFHVAAVRTGSDVKLYINGVEEATQTFTGDMTNDGPLRIGANRVTSPDPNSAFVFPFNGLIDEVRFWNDARTPAEITANQNNELAGNETGLVAYYNFNQGVPCSSNATVTTLIDNSSSGNAGTLTNFDLTGTLSDSCESNWN